MNSFSGTIVAKRQQPHFRHYLVSEPVAHQQGTSKFGERGISTPTYGGLLKQPDNQKPPSIVTWRVRLECPRSAGRFQASSCRTSTNLLHPFSALAPSNHK